MEAKKANNSCKILMFPWLAHGHIFPYLELSKRICNRNSNFHIYFCSTPINFTSINTFIHQNSLQDFITPIQLNLQSTLELPSHYHTTKNLPSHLNFTLLKSLQAAHLTFNEIINSLTPDLVVYDVFQPWASKIAFSRGISAVYFSIFGALCLCYRHHEYSFGKDEFPFKGIKFESYELKSLDYLFEFLYANVYDVDQDFLFGTFKQSCELVLVKSSKGVEEKYIDYLSELASKKIIPVGSLVDDNKLDNDENDANSEIIQWLDKKNRNSTVYISFGSEYFLSDSEIGEIAKGLEICESVNFIWIIRFPVGVETSLESALPNGFLERTSNRGLVLSGWAPQNRILSHPNTGGFVSHCGWSSVMESMYLGVPVIAMPMKLDQPINARMLTEAGCSVEVRKRENEGYTGECIAEAIKKVVSEESGQALRERARKLSENLRVDEENEMDVVAKELWELCLKYKMKRNTM